MYKKHSKTIKHYVFSLFCILGYFLLENPSIIPELVENSEKFSYGSFSTFFMTGILKYGLLFIGISRIIIITFFLIRGQSNKVKQHELHTFPQIKH